ncbi:MAG: hypothetical protein QOD92_3987 [Acidimicrobiaceae bacterium]|jgi:hypothetical protein
MFTRRIATAAVLLAFFGAACGTHSDTNLAAGAGAATVLPGAAVAPLAAAEATTTTASTLPPDSTVEPAPTPVVKAAPNPAPATIEVDYQPNEGETATATIDGPGGSQSKSLDGGSAVFTGLAAGTYAVTITVDSAPVEASDGTGIGTARQITNGEKVHVEPGEHGVIVCDDNGCSGAL